VQFCDWWIDGRIPIKSNVYVNVTVNSAQNFVSKAIETWMYLTEKNKSIATNLLYLYSKSGSLEWDWERFQLECIVFDACSKIGMERAKIKKERYPKHFNVICEAFGLEHNKQWFDIFIKLRTDLFHEALWDGGQPNTFRSSDSFFSPYHFRKFNHRLITAIFANSSAYTKSKWWLLHHDQFDV